MAVRITGKNIDEKYSKLVEPNLYYDSIFRPGATCSDRYKENDAGVIYVHKLGAKTIAPAAPGGDYSHQQDQDSLITIAINNEFKYSEKISKIADDQTAYPIVVAEMEDILATTKEARDLSGLACLGYEGTAITSNTQLAANNIKAQILAVRKALVETKVKPTTVLCSAATYALILEAAGTQYTPVINDKTVSEGRVGRWLGLDFIECPAMVSTAATYYDYSGTLRSKNLSGVDFIMYSKDAFSVLDTLQDAAVVDGRPIFWGSFVQTNMLVGYRVTNSACVAVRSYSAG
ncbi:MAG: hypothetical protein VZQ98_15960 [Bacteroidales bacterium]|nr:hypothetical protein [Bacteroidales bacterium]